MSVKKRPRLSVITKHQPSLLLLAEEKAKLAQTRGGLSPCNWYDIPLEILVHIFNFLGPKDKQSVALVCSHWYLAINIPSLWKHCWITLKPGLMTRSDHFWSLVKSRAFNKILLYGKNFHEDMIALHINIPELHGLHVLSSYQLETKDVRQILKFNQLSTLILDFKMAYTSTLTIKGLDLNRLPSLQELHLAGVSDLSMFDLSFLSHPRLLSLAIESCGSFKAGDTNNMISHFPHLQKLEIKSCIFYHSFILKDEGGFIDVNISSLSLARTSFDGALCEFPSCLINLQSLDLLLCQQSQTQLTVVLSELVHLKELNLRGNHCGDGTLMVLPCSQLQCIDLSFNHDVTLTGLKHLGRIVGSSLIQLKLAHCVGLLINKSNVLDILPILFPNVQTLDLCGWNLSAKDLEELLISAKKVYKLYITRTNYSHSDSILTITNNIKRSVRIVFL